MTEQAQDPDPDNGLSDRSLQTRAATGAAWTMAHTVLALSIAFFVNILMARILGVVDYGRLAILMLVIDIAGIVVAVGVGSAVMQFGARAHAMSDHTTVQQLLSGATGFRLLVGAPLITIAVVFFVQVPTALLFAALIFGVWLPSWTNSAAQSLAVENRTATAAKVEMIVNLLVQLAVVAVLLTLATADAVWAARLAVLGLGGFLCLRFVSPAYRIHALRPGAFWKLPRPFWQFALPTGLASLVSFLAIQRTEILVLEWSSTAEAVGLFAMAYGLSGHLFAPVQAMMNPLIPAISGLRAVHDAQVGTAFLRVIRISATSSAGMMAVLAPVLAILVPVLYGADFAAAQGPVLVLAQVAGLTAITTPMQIFVMAHLRGVSTLRTSLVSLLADLIAAIVLIPVIGLWGAVAAKTVMILTRFFWLLSTEPASFGVSRRALLAHGTPFVLGLVTGTTAYFTGLWTVGALAEWGAALVAGTVGFVLLITFIRLTRTGITIRDREVLMGVLPAAVSRVASLVVSTVTHRRG